MLISPKVFGVEKRNCTFWKWQSFSFKMVCVTYTSDKNYGFYRPKHTFRKGENDAFWLVKSDVYVTHTILKLKLCHFQKVQSRFSSPNTFGVISIWMMNRFRICLVWCFFLKMTLHIQVVVKASWNDFYLDIIKDNQMSYQYKENEILLTNFRRV